MWEMRGSAAKGLEAPWANPAPLFKPDAGRLATAEDLRGPCPGFWLP